jgi:hypothetical protein
MLLKPYEEREKAKRNLMKHHKIIKRLFDKSSKGNKDFQEGDLVLKWDKSK